MYTKESEKPLFDITDRDYNIKAWYLAGENSADALVEVSHAGEIIRKVLYPAYKIYNLAAHFSDIVDGELSDTDKDSGYKVAGSNGLGGCVMPEKIK